MLDVNELLELEEELRKELDEKLEQILAILNRNDQLEELLNLLGLQDLLGIEDTDISEDGIILVIGQSDVKCEKLSAVARELGLDRDRFEFHLNYDDAKTFDFKKTQWSTKYSCILVGAMPHSGYAKGDYSSVITALESEVGYPPVYRLGNGGLNITKTSFRNTLQDLVMSRKIA